jgi:hypothetical protein
MFDYKQTLTERLADAVDLLIDFATLGEYGLEEPAGRTSPRCGVRQRPSAFTGSGPTRRPADRSFALRP